ncbi:G1/S-specific cyclin-E2-like [Stegastes partitus]|uniref:G1/S-specific cyclin-E2-like n=1 Tax=Stegastes partitus TaxID=144197 RepID=A0A3B4Z2B0_9TELE|nr:PREDICTED: G1/S-specific cyclin-E2-like [Stegastes partitus]
MTRRSGRQRKRSENASRRKGKVRKQSNRKMDQPLAKLQLDKNRAILEGVSQPCLIGSPEKTKALDFPALTSSESMIRCPLRSSDAPHEISPILDKRGRSLSFIEKHPTLQPRMRSILLDWLIEVSEAYTLHRQTFYLAQEYFDRFMLTQSNIEKGILQLIGVTCLFIASKMEESSPPKLSDMVYVTAGTYFEEEVLQMELIILKELQWNLCPETLVSWLQVYFQLASMDTHSDLLEPHFPVDVFLLMTRLLDLCVLDLNSLNFEYRVLAASVLCHFIPPETVEEVSGLPIDALRPCMSWMAPFVDSVGLLGKVTLRDFNNVKTEDRHNIQTHANYMSMLDGASQKMLNGQIPTPPSSTEKTH